MKNERIRNGLPLNPRILEALTNRSLDPEVVTNLGIYSGRRADSGEDDKTPIPDVNGNVCCYPYFDVDGKTIINAKFVARGKYGKTFWQPTGGRKSFYGLEVLHDPAVKNGQPVVIVEGENDRIAVISAGYPWVMSVPEGGSPHRDKSGRVIPMRPDNEIDPDNDVKFKFIFTDWDELAVVQKFIIWTDNDEVGERLRHELSRRLGPVRCSYVTPVSAEAIINDTYTDPDTKEEIKFKRPVKDANEVLQFYGADHVIAAITTKTKECRINGLSRLTDFEDVKRVLYSTGMSALENNWKLYEGMFAVMSGLPGSGKSVLADQIAVNAAILHEWRVVIATFEEDVRPDLLRKLRAFFIQKDRREWTDADIARADAFIEARFFFITRDPTGMDDEPATVEWLVEKIEDAVIRYGVHMVIIDPYNQLDHTPRPGERSDQYAIRSIKMLKDLTKRRRLCTIIVVHPDKRGGGESQRTGEVMSMYDIADGAVWNNMAEVGVIVWRKNFKTTDAKAFILKPKFRGTAKYGDVPLEYDEMAEMYMNDNFGATPEDGSLGLAN